MRVRISGVVGRTMMAAIAVSTGGIAGSAAGAAALPTRAAETGAVSQTPPPPPVPQRRGGGRRSDGGPPFTRELVATAVEVIPLGPAGLLELKTGTGHVSVVAGSGRDVRVEITRRSRGRTDADAQLGLDQVKTTLDHHGERAVLAAVYPDRRAPYRVEVSYNVTAPANTRVIANVLNGGVTIRQIKGDVTATTSVGSITLERVGQIPAARTFSGDIVLRDVETTGTVLATSVSGSVTADRVNARRFEVETMSGAVTTREVTCLNAQVRTLNGAITYVGRLVSGGRYHLQTHEASIAIGVAGSTGFELQADAITGEVRTDPALNLKGASSTRERVRGTVGDGTARVTALTFSGTVTIEKK
jgi:hypothetical protein